jgi:hypothetical protein
LTFLGYGGGDDTAAASVAAATCKSVKRENGAGSVAAYTVNAAANTGWFPLGDAEFGGLRYIVAVSDQTQSSTATARFVSKPR